MSLQTLSPDASPAALVAAMEDDEA